MKKLTLIIAMAIRVPHCQSQDVIFGVFVNFKPHLHNILFKNLFHENLRKNNIAQWKCLLEQGRNL